LAEKVRHVVDRRLALRVRAQVPPRAQHRVQLADDVHRQPYGARLVHDRALDVLPDPPRGVGREAEPALGVELVERVHEPEVPLLDQVEQRHAAVQVLLGDVHHEPQVVLDHLLPGAEVAGRGEPGVMQLLDRREQAVQADVVEVDLGRVAERLHLERRFVAGVGSFVALLSVLLGIARAGRGPLDHGRSGWTFAGSIGLRRRRISKWSFAWVESVLPISAIFWPRTTLCPSFTRRLLLCAYAERYVLVCLMMMSLPYPRSPCPL